MINQILFDGSTYAEEEVTIPNGVTVIGYGAFESNKNIRKVTIPESVTRIEESAFSGSSLREIDIPNSVTYIAGKNYYMECGSSGDVTVPKNVVSIMPKSFHNNVKIKSISMGGSVKKIGWKAFDSCKNLTKVAISSGTTTIGSLAFYDCSKLKTVIIPKSVTRIEGNVFANTIWLKEKQKINPFVIVNNILVDGVNCTGKVTIPKGVVTIAPRAFDSSKITSVTFPSTLKDIGAYAFADCQLTKVTIPSNVTNINDYAFDNNPKMTSITIPSKTKMGNKVFGYSSKLKVVISCTKDSYAYSAAQRDGYKVKLI